ncbi:MAG: pyridoxamine 5'-phosphate oxidase family protein [Gammaproteobacteria bacterium]|nr:pyridoxamine 5'-phosphate oxidase family protein [Gammaproteobacteria bacterium]
MGKQYTELTGNLTAFIARQKMFFVGTAAADGRVNVSPKGMDTLRVLTANRAVWLNLTGSGNETAAHLRELSRITLMFCAFEGDPLILRVYGQARALHPRDAEWASLHALFPNFNGARQIIDVAIELVQTSCGFGVPFLDFKAQREQLTQWAEKKGANGIRQYWEDKNQLSLDGKPTEILLP